MDLFLRQVLICLSILCLGILHISEGTGAENILKTRYIVPRVPTEALEQEVPSAQNENLRTVSPKPRADVHDEFENRTEAKLLRIVRDLQVCQTPKKSQTSSIFCKWLPDRVFCEQTCIYGYTLAQGKHLEMECLYEADVWQPVEPFMECKPYVDCTLTPGPGSKLNCKTHFMDHGPVCNVSCAPYEYRKKVVAKSYECNDQGEWSPKLPFCVTAGSDLELVDEAGDKAEYAEVENKNRVDESEDGEETYDKNDDEDEANDEEEDKLDMYDD